MKVNWSELRKDIVDEFLTFFWRGWFIIGLILLLRAVMVSFQGGIETDYFKPWLGITLIVTFIRYLPEMIEEFKGKYTKTKGEE